MQFIRLSNMIINKSKIIKIKTYPDSYYIYLSTNKMTGLFWLCFGEMSTREDYIKICKENDKKDFDIISKWISHIEFNNKHLE